MTGTARLTEAGMETRTRARTAAEATAGAPAGQGRTVAAGAAATTATVTIGAETAAGLLPLKDPTRPVDGVGDDEERLNDWSIFTEWVSTHGGGLPPHSSRLFSFKIMRVDVVNS